VFPAPFLRASYHDQEAGVPEAELRQIKLERLGGRLSIEFREYLVDFALLVWWTLQFPSNVKTSL
jgi:hypothetical protein